KGPVEGEGVKEEDVVETDVQQKSEKSSDAGEDETTIQEKPLSESITQVVQLKLDESTEATVQMKNEDVTTSSTTDEESIQTKGEEEEDSMQMKSDSEEETAVQKKDEKEEPLQTKSDSEEDSAVQMKGEEEEESVQMQSQGEEEKIQTKCAACGKEESAAKLNVQKKCTKCEAEEKVQTKSESQNTASNVESSLKSSKGNGSPMDDKTRGSMESGFGSDFSNVRIHTDSKAVQMNKDLGSKAFTNGSDIYFNEGQYSPSSKDGQHLLAHELTHTVQQGAAPKGVQKQSESESESESEVQMQSEVSTEKEESKVQEQAEEKEGEKIQQKSVTSIQKDDSGNQEGNQKKTETNPHAPTTDPFFVPFDREKELSEAEFKQENKRSLQKQVQQETGKAESEVPVNANIKPGEPTALDAKNPDKKKDKEPQLEEKNGEQASTEKTPKENREKEKKPANNKEEEKRKESTLKKELKGEKDADKIKETPKSDDLPPLEADPGMQIIQEQNSAPPSEADQTEVQQDLRSPEEKAAEQVSIAAQFTQAKEASQDSLNQSIQQHISSIAKKKQSLSNVIVARNEAKVQEIRATIAEQKVQLKLGYQQSRVTLESNKANEFVRLEEVRVAKIELLKTELETRKVTFNELVDQQTEMPKTNAKNEADRADSELEAAAKEALAQGESVANKHPGSDDGNPEARDSVREIASETAADIRGSKSVIREDLMNTAADFNGGFEDYRNDINKQISSTEKELTGKINEAADSFKSIITETYGKIDTSLKQKEKDDIENLNNLQEKQIRAANENKATGLNVLDEIAEKSTLEVEKHGEYSLSLLDTLSSNVTELLTSQDGTPILSAMRELSQNSIVQVKEVENEGRKQLELISSKADEVFTKTDQSNAKGYNDITDTTRKQATNFVSTSDQQRQEIITQLNTVMQESFSSLETALDEMRTEAMVGIDEAIEDRKGKILEANSQFLQKLIEQNNESIKTAKQPLTDPLISRLWSAADRATASWWEGMLAAIGDFLLILIVIVAFAALLVVAGVFSTITGALLVIGGIILAAVFLYSLGSRLYNGHGWSSVPLAIADTLGITMIYQGVTNKDIATGEDLGMNTFDRWYSGTTGALQFLTILSPLKSRIPGIRNVRIPKFLGGGKNGRIARTVKAIEGVGKNNRTKWNGGVEPNRPPIGDRFINRVAKLNPFRKNKTEEPTNNSEKQPENKANTEKKPENKSENKTENQSGKEENTKNEQYKAEVAKQKAELQTKLDKIKDKVAEAEQTIQQRTEANDAQGDFGETMSKTSKELQVKQEEITALQQELSNADSHAATSRLRERLNKLEQEVDALANKVIGNHGMRKETSDALATMEKLLYDPLGDYNSQVGKNHYNAARIEAKNEPLYNGDKIVAKEDGTPYSHIRDLQNAHDAMVNIQKQIQLELENPSPGLTDKGIEVLFAKDTQAGQAINRVSGFLNEIGWPPSRPHKWVQENGKWIGEGDLAVLKPRTKGNIELQVERVSNTQRGISRLRNREAMTELLGRRRELLEQLDDLQTQLENTTTEAQVHEIEGTLNTLKEDIGTLEHDVYLAGQ
ncbi:MAG: DUF4157 domain-containing protein, partial [bacterium]|nr:DUF4157 domain-containing protein [bacterium]